MIALSQRALAVLIGAALAANGFAMLFSGLAWYGVVPGVTETGPFNGHFIKDIGAAYLAAGAGLVWFALKRGEIAFGAAISGTAFVALHALIHLAEAARNPEGLHHLARDFTGVFLPPILAALSLVQRRHEDA